MKMIGLLSLSFLSALIFVMSNFLSRSSLSVNQPVDLKFPPSDYKASLSGMCDKVEPSVSTLPCTLLIIDGLMCLLKETSKFSVCVCV